MGFFSGFEFFAAALTFLECLQISAKWHCLLPVP